jgi:hypothetical protein
MFALLCHVLVALRKLFIKDLTYSVLGANRPQGDRIDYQDDLVALIYLGPKLGVLGHQSICYVYSRWCEIR